MQLNPLESCQYLQKRIKLSCNRRISVCSWRHPRTVLWSSENVYLRWVAAFDQLFVPWGLRRQRSIGDWSLPATVCTQVKLPQEFFVASRQPRVSSYDWKFYFQKRGSRSLWLRDIRSVYGGIWYAAYSSTCCQKVPCRARRHLS